MTRALSRTLLCLALAAGCRQEPLGLEGFACDGGKCVDGFVCNPLTDLCVEPAPVDCDGDGLCPSTTATGDDCPSAGAFLPCADDVDDCRAGCRLCSEAGHWGECTGCDGTGVVSSCAACGDDCLGRADVVDAECDTSGAAPVCVVLACTPGLVDGNSDGDDGCEATCVASGAESCDGDDDDCSGVADDMSAGALSADCSTKLPIASHVTSWSCDGACQVAGCAAGFANINGVTADGCEYACTPSGAESCNGDDDDCTGLADDMSTADVQVDCSTRFPSAAHVQTWSCSGDCTIFACASGFANATGGVADGCESPCVATGEEACGDDVDNDCNGIADDPDTPGCDTFYADVDGDGLGVIGDSRCLCAPAAPYTALAPGDCDPPVITCSNNCTTNADADLLPDCKDSCVDLDKDNYGVGSGCNGTDCQEGGAGGASCNVDCGTNIDPDAIPDCRDSCIDIDGDGHGPGGGCPNGNTDCQETGTDPQLCNVDCSSSDPADDGGTPIPDCRDDCVDADQDGHGPGGACPDGEIDCQETGTDPELCNVDCSSADPADDGGTPIPDCRDDCVDPDNDGKGVGTGCAGTDCDETSTSCAASCVDTDSDGVFDCKDCGVPSTLCTTNCADTNGDGDRDCDDDCVDFDGDGYGVNGPGGTCLGADCDDTQSVRAPHCAESCTDADGDNFCRGFDCRDTVTAGAACTTDCDTCQPAGMTVTAANPGGACAFTTLTVNMNGLEDVAADISCSSPRFTLFGPTSFADQVTTPWTLSVATTVLWRDSFPTSCPANSTTDYFVKLNGDTETMSATVDASGYENLTLEFMAGFKGDPPTGRNLKVSAACGATPVEIHQVLNQNDGGTDECEAKSVAIDCADCDDCDDLRIKLSWPSDSDNVGIDDISLKGDLILGPLTTNRATSPGVYTAQVRSCLPRSAVLTCDYTPAGLPALSDSTDAPVVFP